MSSSHFLRHLSWAVSVSPANGWQACHPLMQTVSSLRKWHLRHMCLLGRCENLQRWWPSSQISRSLSFLCYWAKYKFKKKKKKKGKRASLWPIPLYSTSRLWPVFSFRLLNILSSISFNSFCLCSGGLCLFLIPFLWGRLRWVFSSLTCQSSLFPPQIKQEVLLD